MSITRDEAIRILEAQVNEYVEASEEDNPDCWATFATDEKLIEDYGMYVYFSQDNMPSHTDTVNLMVKNWVRLVRKEGLTFETSQDAIRAFLKYTWWGEGRQVLTEHDIETHEEGFEDGISNTLRVVLQDPEVFSIWLARYMATPKDDPILKATNEIGEGSMEGKDGFRYEVRSDVQNYVWHIIKMVLLKIRLINSPDGSGLSEFNTMVAKRLGLIPDDPA